MTISIWRIGLCSIIWCLIHVLAVPIIKCVVILLASLKVCNKDECLHRLHLLQFPVNQHDSVSPIGGVQTVKLYNLRRLFRSQVYCCLASGFGLYLLCVQYRRWPDDMLLQWGPIQQLSFELAASHWIVSIVEDYIVGDEVYISATEGELNLGLYVFFCLGLLSHHMFAIFAYMWCLHTHLLSGLCVFGLLFEVPVVLLNVREIFVSYEQILFPAHHWVWCKSVLIQYWLALHFLWHSTRTSVCVLYITSAFLWSSRIHRILPLTSEVIYHCLGCGFLYINIVLLLTVLQLYIISDFLKIARNG
mmetsp:Transcript_9382/g.14141  ORF Transcript_9382/g.14141 Transcript_9382/m.14141 type:complete len:304 (-) Transcript_9382:262-1173(-)